MSSNTKQVLAITLGSLGLVIGVFAVITAYNAKNAVDDESAVTTQVKEEFAAAQTRQDALEASQASKAEKLIAGLSSSERNLISKISGNSKSIKQLRRKTRSLQQEINSLSSRDKELSSEVTQLSNRQQDDFNKLNGRINSTNKEVNQLQRNIANLRSRVSIDEAASP